jgi:CO/xanthine dehydrogenase FAD-binding subunit
LITLGGSVSAAPIWSDLIGPLLALNAEVKLIGKTEGIYPVEKYLTDRQMKNGTMVIEIIIPDEKFESHHFRATRTHFDYSAFNITLLAKKSGGIIEDIRIVIVGNSDKFRRLTEIENELKGKKSTELDLSKIAQSLDLRFPPKKIGSAEYVLHLAKVELERGLISLLKGEK